MLRALCTGVAALAGCRTGSRAAGETDPSPAPQPLQPASFLVPVESIFGGFTLASAPAPGTRNPPPGPFLALRAPITAAARGTDLFIADAGHDAVFHFDVANRQLRRMPGTGARAGMKLCVLGDRSVLILDPALRRLLRLSRDGAQLARLQDRSLLAGAGDLALEESSGMIWLVDSSAGRLLAVRPALGAVVPVPLTAFGGETLGPLAALASGPDALYAIEAGRSRVLRLDSQGRVTQVFGGEWLRLPRAIAVDRHRRVYVSDGLNRRLHLFRGGRHDGSFAAQNFGASDLSDLRVHDDELAIADAGSARVHLFRVLPERTQS